ncbi:hypothetical protein ACJX0J_031885, partial [Zea mays]
GGGVRHGQGHWVATFSLHDSTHFLLHTFIIHINCSDIRQGYYEQIMHLSKFTIIIDKTHIIFFYLLILQIVITNKVSFTMKLQIQVVNKRRGFDLILNTCFRDVTGGTKIHLLSEMIPTCCRSRFWLAPPWCHIFTKEQNIYLITTPHYRIQYFLTLLTDILHRWSLMYMATGSGPKSLYFSSQNRNR